MPKPVIKSYVISEEVLTPAATATIDYKGKDPFRIYFKLTRLLQVVYHGRGKNVFETSFKWDVTSDPPEFFVETWFKDWKFDNYTRPFIRVRLHGYQPSDPNNPNGIIRIEIKPLMETRYNFHNMFQRIIGMGFIWLYHRLMYNNVRRRYMQIIKERTHKLEVAIREEYGIPYEKPDLTGGAPRLYKSVD
jgi:hypothetical protein